MNYSGQSRGHTVDVVEDNGIKIILDDGSTWQVYEGFASRSADWKPGDLITVKPGTDDEYPFLLVNVNFNDSVECRLLKDREQ